MATFNKPKYQTTSRRNDRDVIENAFRKSESTDGVVNKEDKRVVEKRYESRYRRQLPKGETIDGENVVYGQYSPTYKKKFDEKSRPRYLDATTYGPKKSKTPKTKGR